MNEDFLQFIWQYKLFNTAHLKTLQGDEITILQPGTINHNQGPDFLNARIKVGDTVWAGNIEVHLKSSDFYKHNHHLDKAFSNLILHVVLDNDIAVGDTPTLQLKNYFNPHLQTVYFKLFQNKNKLPCHEFVNNINQLVKTIFIQQLAIERLEDKCIKIENDLMQHQNNWESIFWKSVFRYAGGTVNAQSFELLADKLDWNFLVKQTHQELTIEACLFGMAGFLSDDSNDAYITKLKKEFTFYQERFKTSPLDKKVWRFMRMRPNAFPTIRISQLAQLLKNNPNLFSKILEIKTIEEIYPMLAASASNFWITHYTFNDSKKTNTDKKSIGKGQKDNWIINTIIPFLFTYGHIKGLPHLKEIALFLLEKSPPEQNNITRFYNSYGFITLNATDTQGLLQLQKKYCLPKQCLKCAVGIKILKGFST